MARTGAGFSVAIVVYAVLSLTAIRMLPVALALVGTGFDRATVIFMGWFGPRGLASIVLGLVYLEGKTHLPGERTIVLTVMATVLLSIFAHGLSAKPGIALYAKRIAALGPDAPELHAGSPGSGSPTREGVGTAPAWKERPPDRAAFCARAAFGAAVSI